MTPKAPLSAAPSVVLPTERKSAKLDLNGIHYIPGAEYFFDDGVKELVKSTDNDPTFTFIDAADILYFGLDT